MNPQSCYICSQQTRFYCKNIFVLTTKHSDTPILKYLEQFAGHTLHDLYSNNTDEANVSSTLSPTVALNIICQSCITKLDEYDLAITTALKVENDLKKMLLKKKVMVPEFEVEYVVEENDFEDNNFQTKIILKCTKCDIVFDSLNEMSLHTHGHKERNLEEDLFYSEKVSLAETLRKKKQNPIEEYFKPSEIKTVVDEEPEEIEENIEMGEDEPSDLLSMEFMKQEDDSDADPDYQEEEPQEKKKKSSEKLKIEKPKPLKKCKRCSMEFNTKDRLQDHMQTMHNDFRCSVCGALLKDQDELSDHIKKHDGKDPLECVECNKIFKKKGRLVPHMAIHTGEKAYQCEQCGKEFIHHSSFRMHLIAHKDIRSKTCTTCGVMFRSSSHLKQHVLTHTGDKPHGCPVCGQKFAQRYNMMAHHRTHFGMPSRVRKSHSCSVCNAVFQRMGKLTEHLQKCHDVVEA